VRKLLNFAKQADGLSGEALIEFCVANDVAVIKDSGYDPFAGRSEAEKLEWFVFTLFLSCDTAAGRGGMDPDHAWTHVEWILQRPFQNVDEWLGDEGVKCRSFWSRRPEVGRQFETDWAAFRDSWRGRSQADIEAEHQALISRFREAEATGKLRPIKRVGKPRRVLRSRANKRHAIGGS
jgi:hypothetical protein